MISSFLRWLIFTDRRRGQAIVLVPPVATCPQLNGIFGTRSPTANSPFANQTPLQTMALALSDRTRVSEFFILNSDINTMKTVIMSYTLDTTTVPSLALSLQWRDIWQKMRYVSLVFIYMRANPISNVFLATNTRMRNILCVLLLSLDYIATSLLLFCYFCPIPLSPPFPFLFPLFLTLVHHRLSSLFSFFLLYPLFMISRS